MKDRLRKWNLNTKNVNDDNMREIARIRLKRKVLESKDSAFRVNKQPVKEIKIDRFLKRKNISDYTLLSMASPINGEAFPLSYV